MSTLAARLVLPLRRPLAAVSLSPRMQRRLLVALAALVLLSGIYLLWFRDSGFVRVRSRGSVRVGGRRPRGKRRASSRPPRG